jgi:uncharacterized membrane protein (DUF373 family)
VPHDQLATVPIGRKVIVGGLSLVEDVVYVGLGVLLTITALTLLAEAVKSSVLALFRHQFAGQAISLLDQILLILLIIELLYTVQVSFREHGLLAEPFVVVALIAVIRRILVLTAEMPKLPEASEDIFRRAILELTLLAFMVIILVGSLILLQRRDKPQVEENNSIEVTE